MKAKKMPLGGGIDKAGSGFNDNSLDAQRNRLLEALRQKAITTLEARRKLDILHPAGRVFELRDLGFEIETVWTHEITEAGQLHRVARYLLARRKGGAL